MNKGYYTIAAIIMLIGLILTDCILYYFGIDIRLLFFTIYLFGFAALEWAGVPWAIDKRYRGTQSARELQKATGNWVAIVAISYLPLELAFYLGVTRTIGLIAVVLWIVLSGIAIYMAWKTAKKYEELYNIEPKEKEKSRWIY